MCYTGKHIICENMKKKKLGCSEDIEVFLGGVLQILTAYEVGNAGVPHTTFKV